MRKVIRCPLCLWRPDGRPYWACDRCDCFFDTFATRARCPACGKTWLKTQCALCDVLSLHEDWYEDWWQDLDLDVAIQEVLPAAPHVREGP